MLQYSGSKMINAVYHGTREKAEHLFPYLTLSPSLLNGAGLGHKHFRRGGI